MGQIREIKLYGDIHEDGMNSAASIIGEIEWAKKTGNDIVVCVHSGGGDAIEGNAIAAAIAKAGATIRIEGLAASMAAFMLPYAKKVEMVDNGFIMLHEPCFPAGGTAEELERVAKQLRGITSDFVAKLILKTGKDEKTVRSWLDGENWYTASEAKEMGLVDEIIPSIAPVIIEAKTARNSKVIYSRFAAYLIINQNKEEMDKKSVIAKLDLTGVTAESSDAEIEAAIEAKITAEKTAREQVEASLAVEKTAREAAEATIAAEKQKELDGIVAAAVAEKRITADKKDTFLAIGKSAGIEALRTAIEAIPVTVSNRITAMLNRGGSYESGTAWEKRNREIRGEKD
jgi:ATP-dependent protease ClpP protease subunit